MTLLFWIGVLCLVAAGVIALAAAYRDVVSFTLPNWLTGLTVISFIIFALAMFSNGSLSPSEVGHAVLAGTLAFAAGLALYLVGTLGGGDVKYLAGAMLWAAPVGALDFILVTSLAGAGVAVIYLAAPFLMFRLGGSRAADGARRSGMVRPMPYGVAISFGLAWALWRWAVRLAQ